MWSALSSFIASHGLTILFGVISAITSVLTVYYYRLEHKRKVEDLVGEGRQATLFLSRTAMLKQLLKMYREAKAGDIIWGQCVGCTDYSNEVRSRILDAASRGVVFQMVINHYAPSRSELKALYESLRTAEVLEATDTALRVQGLSDREVILGLPGVDSYTGILIRDAYTVRIIRDWYENRLAQLRGSASAPALPAPAANPLLASTASQPDPAIAPVPPKK